MQDFSTVRHERRFLSAAEYARDRFPRVPGDLGHLRHDRTVPGDREDRTPRSIVDALVAVTEELDGPCAFDAHLLLELAVAGPRVRFAGCHDPTDKQSNAPGNTSFVSVRRCTSSRPSGRKTRTDATRWSRCS